MPDISRRGFLRGLLTVAGAAVVAPAALAQPILTLDPDRVRWERGEGRIWQVRGPRNRSQLVSDMLRSQKGRSKLAASMTQSIHERLHHEYIKRKTLLVEQLPDGPLPSMKDDLTQFSLDFRLEPGVQWKDGKMVVTEVSLVPNDIGTSIERWHDRMWRP